MNKRIGNIFKGDKVIWMVFFFLCMISIVEVFSASSGLTYKSHNYVGPIAYHTGTIIAGVVVAVVTLNIPCRYFKLLTPFLMLITAIMLLIVMLGGGKSTNDASRWISIMGFTIQPSEIAKGTIVLAVAQILAAMQRETGADRQAFKWILWITIPACLAIGVENLSTAALLFGVVVMMMFIGQVPIRQLAKLVAIIAACGIFAISMVMIIGHDTTGEDEQLTKVEQVEQPKKKSKVEKMLHRADTWKSRILKFGKDDPTPQEYDLDKDAQVAHANIAIVSSGIVGKGPGQSVERDFLAQAFSDFIYAIVIEELGILGAFAVMFLYIVLLYRCARIASRCENNFPAFLAMGLGLLLVVQATFNMMVAVGLAPVTGQPLPLISKGGTSTIINCAYIGAILSVSRSAKIKKGDTKEKDENISLDS
ncbi:MAG: FtsW/RodA/SpoVE family cell cycle protein [Prevotella sp.]|jgi:cell division protein FtsW|nr:FtsW/RodA/SpoVE family cell cycle protein [Prevotella sp.]